MSTKVCQYHGSIRAVYNDKIENGKVYIIKNEEDIEKIAKEKLFARVLLPRDPSLLSTINLKEKNIALIYVIDPGCGAHHAVKQIQSNGTTIDVEVVSFSIPGWGGMADMNADFFVLSFSKSHEIEDNFNVSIKSLKKSSEQEFEGYTDPYRIDKKIKKQYLKLDYDIQDDFLRANQRQESIVQQTWFKALTPDQQNTLKQYKAELDKVDERLKNLGNEKLEENELDLERRYRRMSNRLYSEREFHL